MTENEEIDLSKARRWQTVVQAIARGESLEAVTSKVRDCLHKTLRSLVKKIPLNRLIRAVDDGPSAVHRLFRECFDGRDYAELFAQVTAEGGSRETILENFTTDICNSFFDQIIHEVVPSSIWPDISSLRGFLNEVLVQLRGDVERIATKFADNPDWSPRQARRGQTARSRDVLAKCCTSRCWEGHEDERLVELLSHYPWQEWTGQKRDDWRTPLPSAHECSFTLHLPQSAATESRFAATRLGSVCGRSHFR